MGWGVGVEQEVMKVEMGWVVGMEQEEMKVGYEGGDEGCGGVGCGDGTGGHEG